MGSWLLRESGAQHPGSVKRFECGVYGALTIDPIAKLKVSLWDVSEMRYSAFPCFISLLEWRCGEAVFRGFVFEKKGFFTESRETQKQERRFD
jgi:hypothetical protein